MEFNVSSFYEPEETSQTKSNLNSTVLDQECKENPKKEWKLSPIVAEESRQSIFRERQIHVAEQGSSSLKRSFKSPLKLLNPNKSEDVSGYESKSTVDGDESSTNAESQKVSLSADISSFIANNSLNPFDSIIINSLHKSINFSPRVVFSQESCSQEKDGSKFQWSVEQLAVLKPAHISEDEIAASYHSPIPEVEEKIQEVLNEYWSKNVSYIPSPDGPRYVHLPSRDGKVTTIVYGAENSVEGSSRSLKDATPALSKIVRKREAAKAAYSTSSPKQRPRRNIKQMRHRVSQTDITIPPGSDLDLKRILGDAFVFNSAEEYEDDGEEVFDVSMSSNISMRRRLFSANEEDSEDANASMLSSCDNLNESQPFNDSLSPVRKTEDDEDEPIDESDASALAKKSHASQIAINISILNDCMMQSIDQGSDDDDEQEDKENKRVEGNEEHKDEENIVFHDEEYLNKNEFSMLDASNHSNVTPRREDLDWTPRRVSATRPARFREFMFELSPIHAGKMFTPNRGGRTPKQ